MSRISERIRYVGVNDLKKVLFEGMWPLPFGVSYNSYLVMDEKVALIDTVEAEFADEYMDNIRKELFLKALSLGTSAVRKIPAYHLFATIDGDFWTPMRQVFES